MRFIYVIHKVSKPNLSECPAVTAPEDGTVSPPALLASPAGTTLTFTCNKGYSLVGAANTTCLDNGTWSDPQPTCQSIRCPLTEVLPSLLYASHSCKKRQIISITCKRRF